MGGQEGATAEEPINYHADNNQLQKYMLGLVEDGPPQKSRKKSQWVQVIGLNQAGGRNILPFN